MTCEEDRTEEAPSQAHKKAHLLNLRVKKKKKSQLSSTFITLTKKPLNLKRKIN